MQPSEEAPWEGGPASKTGEGRTATGGVGVDPWDSEKECQSDTYTCHAQSAQTFWAHVQPKKAEHDELQ